MPRNVSDDLRETLESGYSQLSVSSESAEREVPGFNNSVLTVTLPKMVAESGHRVDIE